jgi:hypothetical protein
LSRAEKGGRAEASEKAGHNMPILEAKADSSASRKIRLATALGAVFGFQSWRLAEYAAADAIPWYGMLWLFLSPVLLGLSLGATARFDHWLIRALLLWPVFAIPSAWVAHASVVRWAPLGAAVMIAGLIDSLLIAFITDGLFPGADKSSETYAQALECPARRKNPDPADGPAGTLRRRLAEANASLEYLDAERESRRQPAFGKATEDRAVWRELLDLELQDIDERLTHICGTAGRATGAPPGIAGDSKSHRHKGGAHEPDNQ